MIKNISINYEINCNESGEAKACFKETITRLIDDEGTPIAQKRHRDVLTIAELRAAIANMKDAPLPAAKH